MNIRYDDKEHKYYNGDAEELISVTKIASEICGIDTEFLANNDRVQAAADAGSDIHSELANWYDPECDDPELSEKALAMSQYLDKDAEFATEQIVWNAERGYAGTADLIHIHNTTCKMIVDFKTMNKPNKKYCQIQLSLYRLALEHMGYDCGDTQLKVICPKGVIELDPLTWDEMVALRKVELELDDDTQQRCNTIEKRLSELKPFVEEYKALEEQYKAELLSGFEQNNATKYTNGNFQASFVAPSVRVSLDAKRLKEEHPDIYDAYAKESQVNGFVKLMIKGEN